MKHLHYRLACGRKWTLRAVIFFCLLLGPTQALRAQQNRWGSWGILTVQLPGGPKGWGGFAEAQVRMVGVLRDFNYYEYKGGISYDISKNFTVLLGVGRYTTYQVDEYDSPLTRETRLWQQLTQSQNIGRLKFEHRYRVEQRWLTHRDRDEYRNRIRYRLNLQIPLNNEEIEAKTWFVSTYNEIFLNPNLQPFERNRLYAGLGYELSPEWILQAGWLNQYDYSPGTPRHKNNLVLTAVFRIPRSHTGILRLPTPFD